MTDEPTPARTPDDDPAADSAIENAADSAIAEPAAESTDDDPFLDPHARKIPSRAGNWALGLGVVSMLLSLFGGAVIGVPAIVLAFVSLRTPDRFRGPAIAGLALGGFAIAATLVLLFNPLFRDGIGIDIDLPFLPGNGDGSDEPDSNG